jgi:hypothetical protein
MEKEPPEGGAEAASGRTTAKADVVQSRGITGAGIELGVVEGNAVSDVNPYLDNATHAVTHYQSLVNSPIDGHTTAVAGFMSSTHGTVRGTAPGAAEILSANSSGWNLSDHQASAGWAIGQGASGLNNSYYIETDGVMHNSDRWADYIVRYQTDVFVKSAGNRGEYADGNVTSPGLGYNVLTVGAIDDFNNSDWSDDRMAGLSSYEEPSGRQKPEVVAVGCTQWNPGDPTTGMDSTTTSSPWTGTVGCGTSYAAPAVTGMVATLTERDSALEFWPESVKAIVIASALHNIEGSSRLSEFDGAGAIDMAAADHIAAEGWWEGRSVNGDSFTSQKLTVATIDLDAGERFRAALAYDSNPSADYTSDPLEGDLDLRLYDSSDVLRVSSGGVDSWEIIDWTVDTAGTYTLVVYNWAGSLTATESTYIGVAWWPGHSVLQNAIQFEGTPTSARDHYRVDSAPASDWWAIAMQPPSGADYDLYLYDDSRYANPADFLWLEDSLLGGDTVEVVVIDRNHAPAKSYYPIVSVYSGTGGYSVQRAIRGGSIGNGSTSSITRPYFVSKAWDVSMSAGLPKYFSLDVHSGDADMGLLLFDSSPSSSSSWYQGRSQRVSQADSAGAGSGEQMTHTTSTSDVMGLVLFNKRGQTTDTNWTLYVDDTAPTGSILINNGAFVTRQTKVRLTLSASDYHTGVSDMRFANEDLVWSAWEPYATEKYWFLSPGNGIKTVHAEFKNNAGQSGSFSDDIERKPGCGLGFEVGLLLAPLAWLHRRRRA